jgi:hypothetical protein
MDDGICQVCRRPPDRCVCPTCECCGAVGDPECYEAISGGLRECALSSDHQPLPPLTLTRKQLAGQIIEVIDRFSDVIRDDLAWFNATLLGQTDDTDKEVLDGLKKILERYKKYGEIRNSF